MPSNCKKKSKPLRRSSLPSWMPGMNCLSQNQLTKLLYRPEVPLVPKVIVNSLKKQEAKEKVTNLEKS